MGIETHSFGSRAGRLYCLDVQSSAVVRIDTVMRDLLEAAGKDGVAGARETLSRTYSREEIEEAIAELEGLQRRGYFLSGPDPEAPSASSDPGPVNLRGISLFVAGDCNLVCRYCYNHGGSCEGDELASMPLAVAERAVDLLLANSQGSVTCTFFGGEPLLHPDLIESVVGYCEGTGRPFLYSLTTNGTVLDDRILAFLARHAFRVLVSYDGDRQAQQRPSRDGHDSRALVRRNIEALASAIPRDKLTVRSTITSATRDVQPLVDEARELGVRLGLGAVTLPAPHPWALSRQDFRRIMAQEEKLRFDELLRVRETGLSPLAARWTRFVDQILEGKKLHYSCGVGFTILAVGTRGGLYPCHRFVGDERFRMGDVFEGIDTDRWRDYARRRVDDRPSCSGCWARYFCGGGCAHHAVTYAADAAATWEPMCELTRFEVELGLRLFATALEECPERLEELRQTPIGEDTDDGTRR